MRLSCYAPLGALLLTFLLFLPVAAGQVPAKEAKKLLRVPAGVDCDTLEGMTCTAYSVDLDRDGKNDVVTLHATCGMGSCSAWVSVWKANGRKHVSMKTDETLEPGDWLGDTAEYWPPLLVSKDWKKGHAVLCTSETGGQGASLCFGWTGSVWSTKAITGVQHLSIAPGKSMGGSQIGGRGACGSLCEAKKKGGRVALILTRHADAKTVSGLKPGDSVADLRRLYGKTQKRCFLEVVGSGADRCTYSWAVVSSVPKGIGLLKLMNIEGEIMRYCSNEAANTSAVLVHAPGKTDAFALLGQPARCE